MKYQHEDKKSRLIWKSKVSSLIPKMLIFIEHNLYFFVRKYYSNVVENGVVVYLVQAAAGQHPVRCLGPPGRQQRAIARRREMEKRRRRNPGGGKRRCVGTRLHPPPGHAAGCGWLVGIHHVLSTGEIVIHVAKLSRETATATESSY